MTTPVAAGDGSPNSVEVLKHAAAEALAAWDADKDSRVGKLLASMAGRLPGYRADIDKALGEAAARSPRPTQNAAGLTSSCPDGHGLMTYHPDDGTPGGEYWECPVCRGQCMWPDARSPREPLSPQWAPGIDHLLSVNAALHAVQSAWRIDLREGQAVAVPTPDVHSEFVAAAPREPLEQQVQDLRKAIDQSWIRIWSELPLERRAQLYHHEGVSIDPLLLACDRIVEALAASRSALPPLQGGFATHGSWCLPECVCNGAALPRVPEPDLEPRCACVQPAPLAVGATCRKCHRFTNWSTIETLASMIDAGKKQPIGRLLWRLQLQLELERLAVGRAARAGADAVRASRGEARVQHEETKGDARVEPSSTLPSQGSTAKNRNGR